MPVDRPNESDEWLVHRIDAWVETYKKSMLTPVVLTLIADRQPAAITTITEDIKTTTSWQVTERGLYRTLKRLQDSGLLTSTETDVPRTGVKRKELSLTHLGERFLAGITANVIDFPVDNDRN